MTRQKSNQPKTMTIRAFAEDHKKWKNRKRELKKAFPLNKWTDESLFQQVIKLVEGWVP